MVDVNRSLVFRGTNLIKLAFEQVLREIFATVNVDERFRYDRDDSKTQLRIYRTWPNRLEFYPMITISSGSWDASLTVAGSEKEEADQKIENGVLTSETFTGSMTIPITLKVFCKQVDDVEQLTDTLVIILRILNRGNFAKFGIGYNKIKVNGESQYPDASGATVFTNSITVDVLTDYTQVLTIEQSGLFDKILLRVFGQEQLNSTPVLLAPLEVPGPFPPV